jgi:hypothetical protein
VSKIATYNGLKADLLNLTYTKQDSTTGKVKFVGLWSNNEEQMDIPDLLPAIYIEFLPAQYRELTNGIQDFDIDIKLHIIFESYKDVDLDVLALEDKVFSVVHKKQYGFWGQLIRVSDQQDFDHTNVQEFSQIYRARSCKTYTADNRPTNAVQTAPVVNSTSI